jgi:hypothetical protein
MLGMFYVAMVVSAFVIDRIFEALKLVPARGIATITLSVSFNYTAVLNIVFAAIALVLAIRFMATGGPAMIRMMNGSDQDGHEMNLH